MQWMVRYGLTVGVFLFVFVGVESLSLNFWTKPRFRNVEILNHFWKNTGFSPGGDSQSHVKFLLSNDVKLNLNFIGSIPNEGIKSVRIHWLLDLITVSHEGDKKPTFHLENLDLLIDRLFRNNLNPSFELMGNPSHYFKDFGKQSKVYISLIQQIISHYSRLYGADYVHEWNFELMNEPDLKQYDPFNFTLDNYLDYFRACEEAVTSLSGPAGLFRNRKHHPLCWGLLDYCDSHHCNLNMITFHRKGSEVGSEVVMGSLDLINSIISAYPKLKGIPFGNDEADIMTGWYKPTEWRADVRYAALVVQVIIGHIWTLMVKRNISFEMLSNDNGFLSFSPNYFTQRTLLARFQMNNTTPHHVQFFRKPVYSVMGMLSLLGDYIKDIHYSPGKQGFSYLMTSYKYQDTFLGVVTDDKVSNENRTVGNESFVDVNVKIGLGNSELSGMCVLYVMDNNRNNPNLVWRNGGSPDFPDADLRREMRDAEGFDQIFIRKIKPEQTHVKFLLKNVSVPSVVLVNICFEGTEPPGQVTDLRYETVTHSEIILFWKDVDVESKCLLTYVVEFKKRGEVDFVRINKKNSIFLSHHHDGFDANGVRVGVAGEYRVAAVDYWNRPSVYSDVLTVSG